MLNPDAPEARRLAAVKAEASELADSVMPKPKPQEPIRDNTPQMTEEDMHDLMKRQWVAAAIQQQRLMKPTPEQAKLSEYLITNNPFVFEENGSLKGGDMPEETLFNNYGTLNRNIVLSKLSEKDARIMDIYSTISELSRMAIMPELDEYGNARLDQDASLNYATIRRALNGFAMESLNKSIHEQVSTLQTQGQVQYAKQKRGRIQQLLGGGE